MTDRRSPRERVELVLAGEKPDMVPFTAYAELLPRCAVERRLRDDGLCLVQRSPVVCSMESPNVVQEQLHYAGEDGVGWIRTTLRTPVGMVTTESVRALVGSTPLDRVAKCSFRPPPV